MNVRSALSILLFSVFSLTACCQDSTGQYEFSLDSASPAAKAVMKEDFYWNPVDETAPFGNDAGYSAAYGFAEWRINHAGSVPVLYLKEMIKKWKYPPIAWDELDTVKLRTYAGISARLDEATIEQEIKLMKQYNSQNGPGSKALSDEQLRELVISSSKNIGFTYLTGLDQSLIGTAFAQFVLEGKMDGSLKYYANKAIQRELLPLMMSKYSVNVQTERKGKYAKMLAVITGAAE